MSEYITITIRLKADLARQIDELRSAESIAQTHCNAFEAGGDAANAEAAERERLRINANLAPMIDKVEEQARFYAKAEGIAISEMPAWRVQFCRPDSSVAMVEFFEARGY